MFFLTVGHIIQMLSVLGDFVFYNTHHIRIDHSNNFKLRLRMPLSFLFCGFFFYLEHFVILLIFRCFLSGELIVLFLLA